MLIDCILVEINRTKLTTFDLKRNDALQNNLLQFLKYLAESFDNLKIERQGMLNCFDHQIVTSYIAMVNVVLYSLFEKKLYENPKMENIEFYTCTL